MLIGMKTYSNQSAILLVWPVEQNLPQAIDCRFTFLKLNYLQMSQSQIEHSLSLFVANSIYILHTDRFKCAHMDSDLQQTLINHICRNQRVPSPKRLKWMKDEVSFKTPKLRYWIRSDVFPPNNLAQWYINYFS